MEAAAKIGHNLPPATLADELAGEFTEELAERDELIASFQRAPSRFDDDETQNRAAELQKKLRDLERRLDAARTDRTKPLNDRVREINGFFKVSLDMLEKARAALAQRGKDYLDRKAAEEARRLKAEEDARRAEAERLLRLAKDAEDLRLAAARAAEEAARQAKDAAEAKAAASTEQEMAAADLAAAKAKHAQSVAVALSLKAEHAKQRQAGTAIDDDAARMMTDRANAMVAEARRAVDEAEQALSAARRRAAEAREAQRKAEAAAAEARIAERSASRDEAHHFKAAAREDAQAAKLAAKAAGPEADLARTRSLHGAVSTLQRRWVCEVVDREALDKQALWPFINGEAIEAALYKWMLAQTPERRSMRGASMREETINVTL